MVRLDGAPERQPRLARQRRTWRAVAVTCAVLAVVCVGLSGPASPLALAAQTWQQIQTQLFPPSRHNALPAYLSASMWTAIRLPAGTDDG